MGERTRPGLNISGEQLFQVLLKSGQMTQRDVERNTYLFGDEVMFDFGNYVHFTGARYDTRMARERKQKGYDPAYLYYFLDSKRFDSLEQMRADADLDGMPLNKVADGIMIYPEFAGLISK